MPAGLTPGGWETYRLHTELIALRRGHPWLHRARTEVLTTQNRQLVYGSHLGDDAVLVALSVEDAPLDLAVPGVTSVLAGSGAQLHDAGPGAQVALPLHDWAVLG